MARDITFVDALIAASTLIGAGILLRILWQFVVSAIRRGP